jgi:hypothetical protein
MATLTRPEKLADAARRIEAHAARLDRIRGELAAEMTVVAMRERWEGTACEDFLRHVGPRHRQHHLDVAHDRLRLLALVLDRAAEENRAELAVLARLESEVRATLDAAGRIDRIDLPPTGDTRWRQLHRVYVGSAGLELG